MSRNQFISGFRRKYVPCCTRKHVLFSFGTEGVTLCKPKDVFKYDTTFFFLSNKKEFFFFFENRCTCHKRCGVGFVDAFTSDAQAYGGDVSLGKTRPDTSRDGPTGFATFARHGKSAAGHPSTHGGSAKRRTSHGQHVRTE